MSKTKKIILMTSIIVFIISAIINMYIYNHYQKKEDTYKIIDCNVLKINSNDKNNYDITLICDNKKYKLKTKNSTIYEYSKNENKIVKVYLQDNKLYEDETSLKKIKLQPIYIVCFVILIISWITSLIIWISYKRKKI